MNEKNFGFHPLNTREMSNVENESQINRRQFLAHCGIGAGAIAASGLVGCTGVPVGDNRNFLRAGVAKHRITPPIWIPYLTSSGNGASAPFKGVHDELFARALVLDDGKQSIALLSADSIGYDNALLGAGRDFTAELRKRISSKTDLRPEAVMIASTHSHSTPETICLSNLREIAGVEKWLEAQLQSLAETVIEAWKTRVPVKAFAGATKVENVARNRRILLKDGKLSRYGAIPSEEKIATPWALDEDLSVVYLQKENGDAHSVLLNYTAHPVVAMLLPEVSADYPGVACAEVEAAFQGSVCLFTNGAAGNVNTVSVSTNFNDVNRIGKKLSDAAIAQIGRLKRETPIAEPTVHVAAESIELEPRECLTLSDAERIAKTDPSPVNQRILRLARKLSEGPIRAEIQAMKLGPLKWVSIPGEAFVETGLALKKLGASFVVGYANGWIGYLPIRRAYDEGGYEVDLGAWSRVAPGSAEHLESFAHKLLNKINA